MTNEDRIDLLENAYVCLEDAISNIRQAVRGTSEEARAKAYILPHLNDWLGGHHNSIGHMIAAFENDMGEDDEFDMSQDLYAGEGE